MKIFFLDINRNGLRIPFTQKRIPLPLVATTFVSIFGLPGAAARKVTCTLPEGDFANSCTNIAIRSYLSIDPNVPAICVLTAVCPTMFAGLPSVFNEAFIPADLQLKHVTNNNGSLSHGGKPLSGKEVETKNIDDVNYVDHCLPPAGSYRKTCVIDIQQYISTDPKLAKTDLCEVKATCKSLYANHETTSLIYFNIKSQTLWHNSARSIQKLENCDGTLVQGSDDTRCQIRYADRIQAIADESGRRTRVML